MEKPILPFTFLITLLPLLSNAQILPSPNQQFIGINYGRQGSNLPSAYETIETLKAMQVSRVKIYDSDHEFLKLLSGTSIRVTIMVPDDDIPDIASNQSAANRWVHDNVLAFLPGTMIRGVLVGNEILSDSRAQSLSYQVVPAMRNIKKSLNNHNIHNIKVGTPVAMDIVETSFPPSLGRFRGDIPREEILLPLLNFLNRTRSYFFLDVYPYFSWSENPHNISLDFALLREGNQTAAAVDPTTGLAYTNLLDPMLDSVVFAMQQLGFNDIRIAISETGWPTSGDLDQPGANLYNAAAYNRNLVRKIMANPPVGTPARPGVPIPTFVFSLYNENLKTGPGTERHWGILAADGKPVYELNLNGTVPESEYPPLPEPANNVPYQGNVWCVVASGVRIFDLGPAVDFACAAGNGTCDALAPGSDCYEPVSVVSHANYAFSSFWARFRSHGANCHFNGLATMTTVDPSHGACKVPSVCV
ncbi:unnamed protein product [Cuscuta campestris]|uniref:glucan endo-1,3-beta-D-glucosidase n=1 Tax=Cuscuta campestris TaxID=132261 RepID=A0A484NL54_9ASTE|nr:unnamed protein product [Cuscuta campestris]